MSRLFARSFFVVAFVFSMSLNADTLGPLDGRSAKPGQAKEMSVELGYVTESDFTNIAVRVNYQYSAPVTLYADFGLVDLGSADGSALGFGVRYHLPKQRILPTLDASVRASYHSGSVDFSNFGSSTDIDLSEFSVALHLGGKEAFHETGMKWYGVVSFNRVSTDSTIGQFSSSNSDSEIGFGGGVYMPFGPGEAYAGIEIIDDLFFGLGYRHFIGRAR